MQINPTRRGLASWRTTLGAAALAASLAFAPAVLAQQADPNAVIHIGSLYEPQNLDNTAGAGQGINEAFNGNVYEALFQLTDAGTVVPQLAASYTSSADGLTYTFKLKPGVTFHSGDKLTAADVKYSIERVLAEGSKSSRKKSLSTIASVATPDDQTVVITLSARSISLPYNLSYVWIVDHKTTDITTAEDGTGPYTLEQWSRGSALALTRFDKYWGTPPTNKEVVFQYFTDATALNNALLTGAVDVITSVQSPDSLAQFTNNPAYKVSNGQSTTKLVLAFNDRVKPFDNVQVRKAISRAINNKALLNSIWGNYGSLIGSFVPPTDPWYIDLTGVDPDVTGGLVVERLLFRAHDRFQRRVARLVDRVADADHGRQLDLDGVVAVLGLALAAELAVVDIDLDHLGQRGHLQVVGHDGADRVALTVVRLLAQQDQVGALGLEHLGQRVAGRADVGARQGVVGQLHRAVGAEGDGLVQGTDGGFGTHGHRDDLLDRDRATLLDLHGRLEGVRVEGVEVFLSAAVQSHRAGVDALLNGGVRYLLDQDADLQVKSLLGE